MTIAIICPSRGRPEKMLRMWQSARKTAHDTNNVTLYLGVDEDEQELYAQAIAPDTSIVGFYPLKDWGVVHSINKLVQKALFDEARRHTLFIVAADDTIFTTPHWDKALLDHYNALENKIHAYALLDSRDAEGTPHPIATRAYIEAQGYFYCPIFLHWWADSWMVSVAKHCGVFTHMKDYLLVHDKPSDFGKADSTHIRIRERGWQDRDRHVAGSCGHFLDAEKQRMLAHVQQAIGLREHVD